MNNEEKKPKLTEYKVEDDGKIIRTNGDEVIHVADIKEGYVTLLVPTYRAAITRHLNNQKITFKGYAEDKEVETANIPKKPRKNPKVGDKTKKLVEWYARYNPAAFKVRYGVRELQVRTGFNTFVDTIRDNDGNDRDVERKEPIYESVPGFDYDVNKLLTGEQRLLADRTTHLTIRPEESLVDEDADWDADE